MKTRIGLITTLDHNIGDDFIRTGICNVLTEIYRDRELEFIPINKHKPHTAYPSWHPMQTARLARALPRGSRLAVDLTNHAFATASFSAFEKCDAIIQCGAPVLWPDCHRCEWAVPLWHRVVRRLAEQIPVLNIAAGSCYPWLQQPVRIVNGNDAEFLRAIHGYCKLTTVRDELSYKLFQSLGREVLDIPCSALLASGPQAAENRSEGIILINYMHGGGHFSFGQPIDPADWRETMKAVVSQLQLRHDVAFLCHSDGEEKEAAGLLPGVPRYFPRNVVDYFRLGSRAKAGIFNRMHASVGLAGMGIPSVAIGTDTRLLMVRKLGLPSYYVEDASAELIVSDLEALLSRRDHEHERLLDLRSKTLAQYVVSISQALSEKLVAI